MMRNSDIGAEAGYRARRLCELLSLVWWYRRGVAGRGNVSLGDTVRLAWRLILADSGLGDPVDRHLIAWLARERKCLERFHVAVSIETVEAFGKLGLSAQEAAAGFVKFGERLNSCGVAAIDD